MTKKHPDQDSVQIEDGNAVVPDAEDAPTREDLVPEDPPENAPATGDPDQKPAVSAPIPAHGEMASAEQIQEAAAAVDEADDG